MPFQKVFRMTVVGCVLLGMCYKVPRTRTFFSIGPLLVLMTVSVFATYINTSTHDLFTDILYSTTLISFANSCFYSYEIMWNFKLKRDAMPHQLSLMPQPLIEYFYSDDGCNQLTTKTLGRSGRKKGKRSLVLCCFLPHNTSITHKHTSTASSSSSPRRPLTNNSKVHFRVAPTLG